MAINGGGARGINHIIGAVKPEMVGYAAGNNVGQKDRAWYPHCSQGGWP